jgi:hypothetical protein
MRTESAILLPAPTVPLGLFIEQNFLGTVSHVEHDPDLAKVSRLEMGGNAGHASEAVVCLAQEHNGCIDTGTPYIIPPSSNGAVPQQVLLKVIQPCNTTG